MEATTAKYGCDDFPTPKNPVTLTPYTSGLTGSAVIPKDDTTNQDGTDTGGALSPDAGKDANGDGYPDDAYAPGVQGDPPDPPTPNPPNNNTPPPAHDTGGQSPGGAVPIP